MGRPEDDHAQACNARSCGSLHGHAATDRRRQSHVRPDLGASIMATLAILERT